MEMLNWIDWTLMGATAVVAIVLTIVVMMQSSKEGSSSALGTNTFYGANKGKTMDGILSKLTVILGIVFVVLCFATSVAIKIY